MILDKKQLWILWIGLGLFLAAFGWDFYFSGDRNIQRYTETIEASLHKQEAAADKLFQDDAFIQRRLEGKIDANAASDLARTESLGNLPFNLCIFKQIPEGKDSLVYWTHNDALVLPSEFADSLPMNATQVKLVGIKNSQYELRYRKGLDKNGDKYTISALLPVKKIYAPFESQQLASGYPASTYIPPTLNVVATDRYAYKLTTYDNHVIGSFSSDEDADSVHDIGVLILLMCGFLLLGFFSDRLAKQMLIQNESPMLGICFFVGGLVILRGCVWVIETKGSYLIPTISTNLQLINELETPFFIASLSSLVINTVFFFWFSVFFNKELNLPNFTKSSVWMRGSVAFAYYTVVVIFNILVIGIFSDIINHLDNLLLFESLSDFNPQSICALAALGVLQLAVFLMSHRIVKSADNLNLTNFQHFLAADAAIAIGVFFYNYNGFAASLPTIIYVLVLLTYVSIYVHYVRTTKPGVMWLILWILAFASIQAFFISQFNEQKERTRLQKYAYTLADEHDPSGEFRLKLLVDTIGRDPILRSKTEWWLRSSDSQSISLRIREVYESDPYLSNHYALKTFSSKRTGEIVDSRDSLDRQTFGAQFDKASPITPDQRVRLWQDKVGNSAYLSLIQLPLLPDNPLEVAIQLTRSDMTSSRIFTELLADNPYKTLKHLNEYSYAIYRPDGELRERNQKSIYGNAINRTDIPARENYGDITRRDDNYMEVVFRGKNDTVVMIGKFIPIALQFYNLWILFFVVTVAILLLLTAANHLFLFLPEALNLSFVMSFDTSLSNRLFIPVLAMLMFSYIAIFGFTFNYFKKLDTKYSNADFENKSNSISTDLEKDFRDMLSVGTVLMEDPKEVNKKLAKKSEQYEMAVHFFDKKGDLFATTEDNIFDHGFLARRMNPIAYMKLTDNKLRLLRTEEQIGKFKYLTKFQTIRDTTGELLGFLELPFYSRDRRIRTGTVDWSGTVGVILIMILLICICIVYIWTSSNVSPIQDVARKLRQFRLGDKTKNELITTWRRKDEIGELISAYNAKVEELEDTVVRLAEAERESAWRDMARQVAHEIRNPLTPMKLVVQHVEMLRANNDENLEKYAVRSHKVLLEQIGNLERIVDEFHNFARMPQKAHNEQFSLNDLVQNVADLFAQKTEETTHVDVTLTLPKERFIVYADRILLTGAFNNLVRNAIQAIPKDYKGVIQIKLYREEDVAIVRISDNGTGIPQDIQDKIFSPNFTTKPYGNGIGLLITKNIIQSVNGKIYFETVENVGTDFFIELGIEHVEAIEQRPPQYFE